MLLLVFGAGASYGSAEGKDGPRPPLAEALTRYPEVADKYPASRAVIDYLDRTVGGDTTLEDGLAAFGELAERTTDRMMQLTAFRFYLCDVIGEVTKAWLAYTALLRARAVGPVDCYTLSGPPSERLPRLCKPSRPSRSRWGSCFRSGHSTRVR